MSGATPPVAPVETPAGSAPTVPTSPVPAGTDALDAERAERRRQLRAQTDELANARRKRSAPAAPAGQGDGGGVPAVKGAKDAAVRGKNWLQRQPTPGGVGGAIAALVLLMLLVFPYKTADGTHMTRGYAVLLSLFGKTKIAGENTGSGPPSAEPVVPSVVATSPSGPRTIAAGTANGDYSRPVIVPDSSPLEPMGWLPVLP